MDKVSKKYCVITEQYPAINKDLLDWLSREWNIISIEDISADLYDKVVAIVVRSLHYTTHFIAQFSQLAYILRVWTWLDNLPQDYCKLHNISLVCSHWKNASSVAELVTRAVLWLQRCTLQSSFFIKNQQSSTLDRFQFMGKTIRETRFWLCWFWAVGREIFSKLQALGMQQIKVYDPYVNSNTKLHYKSIEFVDEFSFIATDVDVVIAVVPSTPYTKNMFGENFFVSLQSSISFLNVWRWDVVDENALYNYLSHNIAARAFFDVWKDEPLQTDAIAQLLSLDNFFMTPHLWAMSYESNQGMHDFRGLIMEENS